MYQALSGLDIKVHRVTHRMTQQEFATELGVSVKWLSDVENNKVKPDKVYLRAIANLLAELSQDDGQAA